MVGKVFFHHLVTIIPLGRGLLQASSNLPESFVRAALRRFPIWFCFVQSLAVFTTPAPPKPPVPGKGLNAAYILSVPLVLASRRKGVTLCTAL